MKKSRNSLASFLIALAFVVGLLIALVAFRSGRKAQVKIDPSDIDDLIKSALTDAGYSPRMADIWVAVSRFETADYTSSAFNLNNNLWGMKFPNVRSTTATEKKGNYAYYPSLEDAANDIILYMETGGWKTNPYNKDVESAEELVTIMKANGYFEADYQLYLNGVMSKL